MLVLSRWVLLSVADLAERDKDWWWQMRLMLLCVVGVEFENTCAVSGEMNLSRVALRLYGYVYKIWRLTNIKVEFSVVVVGVDFRSWITQFVSGGRPLFDSRFTKFVLRSSGSIKFVMLFQDSNTDGSSSVTTRIEYLFALQWKINEKGVREHYG